ncbi:MAG: hypothetical protein JWP89_3751 [Schlesneria sp.]|nr:hypothetical protein [Schlesneria sp.]
MTLLVGLLPGIMALIGFVPTLGFLYFWKRKERRELRESPLTRNLLRAPGHSLRFKIADQAEELLLSVLIMVIAPVMAFAVHISQSHFAGQPESVLRVVISAVAGLGVIVFFGWRLMATLTKLKHLSLGLEGELATGEELNQLMLDGCRVFHDIPFPYGNIDHVVVSTSGVYSVNSKMLGKPKSGEGKAEIVVDQQQGIVRFPDREYPIPLAQFESEKRWLTQYLSSAVGRQIEVEPILALPGWFVKERIGRGLVYVINPHKPKKFFVQNRQVLPPESVLQIAHQLEQLVRDVEPSFRMKRERWEDKS